MRSMLRGDVIRPGFQTGSVRGKTRSRSCPSISTHPSRSETKLYHQMRYDGRYGGVPDSLNNTRA